MPSITGIAHIELSVSDLNASARWYCTLLGATEVFRARNEPEHLEACAIYEPQSHTVLAFTCHDQPLAEPFSPRRRGLDHFAFAVAGDAALTEWDNRLTELGIAHNRRDDGQSAGITCTDPDGIAVEFFVQRRRG
jgi:catechol 2,3-dioxygenase-like lactoylglutathione lyase family enzyme